MNSGYYAAFAGLQAKSEALEVAANNLANASTPGYKAHQEFYRSYMASLNDRPLGPLNQAINDFGVLGGATVDFRPGNLELTGNNLDAALEGPGFFVVQTQQGFRYTRNGSFHLGPAGRLLSAEGDPVMGEVEPGKVAPIDISGGPVSISSDGTVSVGDTVAARLHIVDFKPGTEITPEGNSYFSVTDSPEIPPAGVSVRQGFVEASNINPVTGAVGLIFIQRHAEMLMRALSIFNTDFNKTAAEDLPRVQ